MPLITTTAGSQSLAGRNRGYKRFSVPAFTARGPSLRAPTVRFKGHAKEFQLVAFDQVDSLTFIPFCRVQESPVTGQQSVVYTISNAVKQIAEVLSRRIPEADDERAALLSHWATAAMSIGDSEDASTMPAEQAALNALLVAVQAAITRLAGDYELALIVPGLADEPPRSLVRRAASPRDARTLSTLFGAIARSPARASRHLSVDPDAP